MTELVSQIEAVQHTMTVVSTAIEELQLQLYEHSTKYHQLQQELLALERKKVELARKEHLRKGT